MATAEQHEKLATLQENLRAMGNVAVAFSGGVDSTFLLAVAHDVLGDGVLAITNASPVFPQRELDETKAFCAERGIRQIVTSANELAIEGFDHNPTNRCYLCKTNLFEHCLEIAHENGFDHVAEGSNLDDNKDYRPGMKAVRELGIESPLLGAGLAKQDIRDLSHEMGLPTWEKQSFACLASRFPYGDLISTEKLDMVDAAEQYLMELGLTYTRVRIHGKLARIEVLPAEFPLVMDNREAISRRFAEIGFDYTTLDLRGYRTGSMNEVLE